MFVNSSKTEYLIITVHNLCENNGLFNEIDACAATGQDMKLLVLSNRCGVSREL